MARVRKIKGIVGLGANKDTLRPHLRAMGKNARNPPSRFDSLAGAPVPARALKKRILGRTSDLVKNRFKKLRSNRIETREAIKPVYAWLNKPDGLNRKSIDLLLRSAGFHEVLFFAGACRAKEFGEFVKAAGPDGPKLVGELLKFDKNYTPPYLEIKDSSYFNKHYLSHSNAGRISSIIASNAGRFGGLLRVVGPSSLSECIKGLKPYQITAVLSSEKDPKVAYSIMRSIIRNKRRTGKS